MVWPWNCGSKTFAERMKLAREITSSATTFTPFVCSPCTSMKARIAWKSPSFNPDSCVPHWGVGMRLT